MILIFIYAFIAIWLSGYVYADQLLVQKAKVSKAAAVALTCLLLGPIVAIFTIAEVIAARHLKQKNNHT